MMPGRENLRAAWMPALLSVPIVVLQQPPSFVLCQLSKVRWTNMAITCVKFQIRAFETKVNIGFVWVSLNSSLVCWPLDNRLSISCSKKISFLGISLLNRKTVFPFFCDKMWTTLYFNSHCDLKYTAQVQVQQTVAFCFLF